MLRKIYMSTFLPSKIREDFPLFKSEPQLAYLDNAATSQVPRQVLAAMQEYYAVYKSNVHRGLYPMAVRATEEYEQARAAVARFIGAQPEEVIFTRGTTESLNMLAHALGKNLQADDRVEVFEDAHHSNLVPWQQLGRQGHNTKIIASTHVSHVLGTVTNVKKLRKQDALLIVDAAQSVPHMPVHVKELDCDFLAFSGHKMLGPTGIGVLYGKRELLEKLTPHFFGGGMIREVTIGNATWTDVPHKFEAGTPPIAEAIGLRHAVEYLQSLGMQNILAHERELAAYAYAQLSSIPGLTMYSPAHPESGILSFNLEGVHAHDVAEVLAQENVAVRAGHHCAMPLMSKLGVQGTVRASFYLYNTKEDADRLAAGVKKAKKIFHG